MHLGISAYFHDSSVALINDNCELIDFKKEEWLSRVKGDKSFPRLSLISILQESNITEKDISSITFYEKPLRAWLSILKYTIKNISLNNELSRNYFKNIWRSSVIFGYDIKKFFNTKKIPIFYSDHHLSHTLTGMFYKQNYPYASVVVDGYGDKYCTSIHHVKSSSEIINVWNSEYPNSLGLFYSAITDFLGFQINEGEYKVMGLAAYGHPEFYDELKKTIYFKDNKLELNTNYFDFVRNITRSYSQNLSNLFGIKNRDSNIPLDLNSVNFKTYANIASSAQKIVEDNLKIIFEHAHSITNEKKFIFTGGVAMNSVAVKKLSELPFVEEIFVPPSPGDSGAAIGAAFFGLSKLNKKIFNLNKKDCTKKNLYPGKINSDESFFEFSIDKICSSEDSINMTASLISKNEIIATCYQNIETGPRALGHRSLICNGHNEKIINYLNESIKNRSKFRPTAPVVLDKFVSQYFDISNKILENYYHMGAVASPLSEKIDLMRGVVHVDNTCRIQVCFEDQLLGKILKSLEKNNIHILANTSFNISSDPMVYSKEDAFLSLERMNLSYLLTEQGLYYRKKNNK